jgi:tetratricopeptide (TPR) repeat protein
VDQRSRLLADYARFLAREKREDDAVALLRKEIEKAPPSSESAKKAAWMLAFDFYKKISVDDALLWNWLASRPKWEHAEQRLLWRLLESAGRDDLDRHFERAESLVWKKDPSRASTLGWIMNRMRFPKRSIPLLKYAVERAQEEELRGQACFTLFESYLDMGDWKHADEIFPEAAGRLTPKEVPAWYARVAVAAAKTGAKTDAMRIWRRVANLSPSQIDGVEDLVEAGLRDELIDFYREMQKKMPSSEVPARVLKALEEN